jgi:hypothetical protein
VQLPKTRTLREQIQFIPGEFVLGQAALQIVQDAALKRNRHGHLEAFIAKELQPWLMTFPADFYQEMYRLRDTEYPDDTVQRPRYFGLLTNDIVYDRKRDHTSLKGTSTRRRGNYGLCRSLQGDR